MIAENSKVVFVGDIPIGGNYPIAIQSMTNTATHDIKKTLNQIISIRNTGANLVRITIPNAKDLDATREIKTILKGRGQDIPLAADIHFSPKLAVQAASIVEKVRINPGNFAELGGQVSETEQRTFIKSKLTELITVCNQYHTSIRIGVNHGSLSERMLQQYGDTPEGMVASVMEYLEIFRELEFDRIIISLKSSNPLVMIYANRLLKRRMDEAGFNFPLHLGVTEAGDGEDGRVKSTIGIGTLLVEGLGDTIRVSLTEPPENEIPVAKKNIQYAGEISNNIQDYKNLILPESFSRRHVVAMTSFDFNKRPEVIIEYRKNLLDDEPRHLSFFYEIPDNFQTAVPVLIPYEKYRELPNVFPVFTTGQLNALRDFAKEKFLFVTLRELPEFVGKLKEVKNLIFIQKIETKGVAEEIDSFISILEKNKMDNPVIFHKEYVEKDLESLQVKAAMDFGRPFVNGYGNGVFIVNTGKKIAVGDVKRLSFSVLQASRALITKTEYIACPSCGRTLFDLETTTQKIRSKTGHLKGLKIAIMGCIVNGVGEMADADYGYVGGAPGKITLYKNKEVVKKNISENNAVDELINLIKQGGDWVNSTIK